MKTIKQHTGYNSNGAELNYLIKDKEDSSVKPFIFIAPGGYDRFFKTLKAAEKAFNKAVA